MSRSRSGDNNTPAQSLIHINAVRSMNLIPSSRRSIPPLVPRKQYTRGVLQARLVEPVSALVATLLVITASLFWCLVLAKCCFGCVCQKFQATGLRSMSR